MNQQIQIVICLVNSLLLLISCGEEAKRDLSTQKELTDAWLEISPCDACHSITFEENGRFLQKFRLDPFTYDGSYEIIAANAIRVTRNWITEADKKTTVHELIFHADDTVEILQFMPVDFGVTGFQDIMLQR